jgi:hypothetical protein
MALGGPGSDFRGQTPQGPLLGRATKPPKVWGSMHVEGEAIVVRLEGWRVVWATKRTLRVPIEVVVAIDHDPFVHERVSTRLRRRSRRVRSAPLFRVGAYHGLEGWSFWACGMARNAVVVETSGSRYRYVVVEVEDPASVVSTLREAAGLGPVPSQNVRSIADAPRTRRSSRPAAVRRPRSLPGSSGARAGIGVSVPSPTQADPAPTARDTTTARDIPAPASDTPIDPDARPDPA